MKTTLLNIGKRYNATTIIENFNYSFEEGNRYALLGGNGSGKSTLIKIISGVLSPNHGTVSYFRNKNEIPRELVYKEISFAAPYIDLILDYNLIELASFHFSIKPLNESLTIDEIPAILHLEEHQTKPLKQYSSGMLQRVKLGLSILANTSLLLLDEPTTNLDANGEDWYRGLIDRFSQAKTIVVCSNHRSSEYSFCDEELNMENYK